MQIIISLYRCHWLLLSHWFVCPEWTDQYFPLTDPYFPFTDPYFPFVHSVVFYFKQVLKQVWNIFSWVYISVTAAYISDSVLSYRFVCRTTLYMLKARNYICRTTSNRAAATGLYNYRHASLFVKASILQLLNELLAYLLTLLSQDSSF